jgi:hypothetical protein
MESEFYKFQVFIYIDENGLYSAFGNRLRLLGLPATASGNRLKIPSTPSDEKNLKVKFFTPY